MRSKQLPPTPEAERLPASASQETGLLRAGGLDGTHSAGTPLGAISRRTNPCEKLKAAATSGRR